MGVIEVPAERYWGAQTERSRRNFRIGDADAERMPLPLIHALAQVKRAAAKTNVSLGVLDAKLGKAIVAAADEVIAGKHDGEFPLIVWQTGSGTQTNMNMNEVLANRANEMLGKPLGARDPIHPNDQVNLGQSSNDCFPTAMHVAAVTELDRRLTPALKQLKRALDQKAKSFAAVVKIGRTHLQDAVPLTLGQEFGAYARQIELGMARLDACLPRLYPLAQGGTAVGTGLNTKPNFARRFARRTRQGHRLSLHHQPQQVRGPRQPRRDGRIVGRAQRSGGIADEDRQRFSSAELGTARRSRRTASCRRTSPARRSCRARSIRPRSRR